MSTFTIILADEPFDREDASAAPFVQIVQHGAEADASTPATLAFRRCLDAIHESPAIDPADDEDDETDGEYDLRDDLNSIYETMEDGSLLLKEILMRRHRSRFSIHNEQDAQAFREQAMDAAEKLTAALDAFAKVADWPRPEGKAE